MARNTELIEARNQYVRDRFRFLCKKNPHWKSEYILEMVAKDVFLSEITVAKILKQANEKVPSHPTVIKYKRELQAANAQQLYLL